MKLKAGWFRPAIGGLLIANITAPVAFGRTQPPAPPVGPQARVAEVSVAARPGSTCKLDPAEIPSGGKSPIIPTDRAGRAHLYVSAAAGTSKAFDLRLVCQDANAQTTQVKASVAASDFVVPKAATPANVPKRVATTHMGALPNAKIDVTKASDADLERLGYPARPDSLRAPKAYAAWLYIVTTPGVYTNTPPIMTSTERNGPTTLLREVAPTPNSGPTSDFTTSATWSGYNIEASSTFTQVNAFWAVPTIVLPTNPTDTKAVQWVGIDGAANEPDVIQDGTATLSVVSLCGGNGTFDPPWPCNVSVYYGWYEYFPDNERPINNFYVRPGDSIQSLAYVTPANGTVTAHFIIWNMTTNQAESYSENTPSGVTSALNQVEWIVERPQINHVTTLLTQTSPTTMVDAAFLPAGGKETLYDGAPQTFTPSQIAMTRDGTQNAWPTGLMSFSEPGPAAGSIKITWFKYQ